MPFPSNALGSILPLALMQAGNVPQMQIPPLPGSGGEQPRSMHHMQAGPFASQGNFPTSPDGQPSRMFGAANSTASRPSMIDYSSPRILGDDPARMFGAGSPTAPFTGGMTTDAPMPPPGNGPPRMFGASSPTSSNLPGAQSASKGHKGLFPGKDGKTLGPILGILGDALRSYGSGTPDHSFMDFYQGQQAQEFDREKFAREIEAKREAALAPRVEQVGNTLGMFDPGSMQYDPIYSAPQPFEAYASSLGHEPGTDEYRQAVQDYRLGAWSDPAMENRNELEGVRHGYRDDLQDQRLNVTRRGQDLQHSDRAAGRAVTRRGQDMTDSRVRSRPPAAPRGRGDNAARAVGADGRTIVVRGGKWVDEKTGQPVQ